MTRSEHAPAPKWGAGSLQAFLRQGLHELRAAIYPDSPIAAPVESGMYGTATPYEVSRQRGAEPDRAGERLTALAQRVQTLAGKVHEREDREAEKEQA